MTRRLLLTLSWLLWAAPALAQTPVVTGGERLGWDMTGPGLGTVQGFRYTIQIDAQAPVVVVATCTGTAPTFRCVAAFPPMVPGPHTVRVQAGMVISPTETTLGPASDQFSMVFGVVAKPGNLGLAPPGAL